MSKVNHGVRLAKTRKEDYFIVQVKQWSNKFKAVHNLMMIQISYDKKFILKALDWKTIFVIFK